MENVICCPVCGKSLDLPAELVSGQKLKCPECGKKFRLEINFCIPFGLPLPGDCRDLRHLACPCCGQHYKLVDNSSYPYFSCQFCGRIFSIPALPGIPAGNGETPTDSAKIAVVDPETEFEPSDPADRPHQVKASLSLKPLDKAKSALPQMVKATAVNPAAEMPEEHFPEPDSHTQVIAINSCMDGLESPHSRITLKLKVKPEA